jgi:hypothetical protein
VNESISYHQKQSRRSLSAVHGIRSLVAERDELLDEVNSLRALLKPGGMGARIAQPLNDHVLELLQHEQEFVDSLNNATSRQHSSESPDQIRTDSDNPGNMMMPHAEYPQDTGISFEDEHGGAGVLSDIPGDYQFWEDLDTILPMSIDLREYPINDVVAPDLQGPSLEIPQPSTVQHLHRATSDEMFLLDENGNRHLHPLGVNFQSDILRFMTNNKSLSTEDT